MDEDDRPEWGWCQVLGCWNVADPIWFDGTFDGDPDLLYCSKHVGMRIGELLQWIRGEGNRTDICTYDILDDGKICSFCRCQRRPVTK